MNRTGPRGLLAVALAGMAALGSIGGRNVRVDIGSPTGLAMMPYLPPTIQPGRPYHLARRTIKRPNSHNQPRSWKSGCGAQECERRRRQMRTGEFKRYVVYDAREAA